jgi:hypothetical protein
MPKLIPIPIQQPKEQVKLYIPEQQPVVDSWANQGSIIYGALGLANIVAEPQQEEANVVDHNAAVEHRDDQAMQIEPPKEVKENAKSIRNDEHHEQIPLGICDFFVLEFDCLFYRTKEDYLQTSGAK